MACGLKLIVMCAPKQTVDRKLSPFDVSGGEICSCQAKGHGPIAG